MVTKQTQKKTARPIKQNEEKDSTYLFKLVMYLVFGSFWIHLVVGDKILPIPVGFLIGILFASHEHFKIDRKIEYAVLLVTMFITYFLAPRILIAF